MIDSYIFHILIIALIYTILALSLQLSLGFTGLLNLGHVAFFAIGAYTSSLLSKAGFFYPISLLGAIVLPSLCAYFLSRATNKLKGDYLALTTIGFSFLVISLITNWKDLTMGSLGIAGIKSPNFTVFNIDTPLKYLIFSLFWAILAYFLIKLITISPLGRLIQAVRDDEKSAQSLAKNTLAAKTVSLVMAAAFAGLAGSLYAHYISFIDPGTFSFANIIPLLTIIILGGLGSLEGTIAATFIIMIIPEMVRFVGLPSSVIGPARQMIFSIILLLIVIFIPKGIDGKIQLTE